MKRQKNSFLTPLDVRVMDSGKRFMVLHQFTYRWQGFKITVPVGFITDFASIPRFARWLLPKLGKYNKAAVIHDYLYQCNDVIGSLAYHRRISDKVFRDGMKETGVAKWQYTVMYWAVRIGGWASWKRS